MSPESSAVATLPHLYREYPSHMAKMADLAEIFQLVRQAQRVQLAGNPDTREAALSKLLHTIGDKLDAMSGGLLQANY